MDPYKTLCNLSKKQALLSSINALLSWDVETYLPPKGLDPRSDQIALMAALLHEEILRKDFKQNLQQLIDLKTGKLLQKNLSKEERINLREWRRNYRQAALLPKEFVSEFAKTTAAATLVWQKARKENCFSMFLPVLKKIIFLCRKKADFLGYEDHPYDALLDLYEPFTTVKKIDPLFSKLKTPLISLLQEIQKEPLPDTSFLHQEFPLKKQMEWSYALLTAHCLDKEAFRLDLSAHPFSTGIHPQDVRITSRIHTKFPISHFFSVLHEGGHGLYEQNLPVKHYGTPVCEAISMGLHESQSRFWEVFIGKSRAFWLYFYPKLQNSFPSQLSKIPFETFYRALHVVQPSLIRVEADELTYSLHIILRYEIEKGLIEGSYQPEDIPELWKEKMHTYLGIIPPSDQEGALQDIHWSMGSFGYFPSYCLGNLFAAQFFATFQKENPLWENKLKKGDFAFLADWLKNKIHRQGKLYSSEELLQRVTKKPLSVNYYLSYLRAKYQKEG